MWFNLPYDNNKVTVELWELITSGFDIWKDFEFDPAPAARYPIFDDDRLRRVIENRYYFRQIGQETPERFRKMFQGRLREVWPYYAQMYESAQLMADVEDPFQAYDLTETYSEQRETEENATFENSSERSEDRDGKVNGTTSETVDGSETRSGSSGTLSKYSDTPQGNISNLDTHLTNATMTDSENDETTNTDRTTTGTTGATNEESMTGSESESGTGSNTQSGTTTYTMTRKGNIGVQPLGKEVEALRASFINIDKMIADELADLFLMVY